jgi:tetratricopeptide (TPR) repeat protein
VRVFISYSSAESGIVRRLHSDLRRSSVDVWAYDDDGALGVDFVQEIEQQILASDVFCLIDSPSARASPHVRMECGVALDESSGGKIRQRAICLAAAPGSWRDDVLFPGQNQLRYFDLHTDYRAGIERLCAFLGTTYRWLFDVPRDQEFQDEVATIALPWDFAMDLERMYARYRQKINTEPRVAEGALEMLLSECRDREVRLLTPLIALALLFADTQRLELSQRTFESASEFFPNDPRGWGGAGAAAYHRARFDEAQPAFRKALALIDASGDERHIKERPNVLAYLAQSLGACGQSAAGVALLSGYPDSALTPRLQFTKGQLMRVSGRDVDAESILSRLTCDPDVVRGLGYALFIELADCYHSLRRVAREEQVLIQGIDALPVEGELYRRHGALLAREHRFVEARMAYETAMTLEPDRIKFAAELGLMLKAQGKGRDVAQLVQPLLDRTPISAEERYFLGLAHFLVGAKQVARREYDRSVSADPRLAAWPFYGQLITP